MWRYLASSLLILLFGYSTASPNTPISLSVSGLPAKYVPGSTLTCDVELTGATDLNAYNVGLELTSDWGKAGTDFYFLGSPDTQRPSDAANDYVFDSGFSVSPIGFVATADTDLGTNTALLSLSDFLAVGQGVSDASPDTMLATVVIRTSSEAGDLTLGLDGTALELLTPAGQPVPGFSTLAANLSSFNPQPVTVVPEPSTFALLCPLLGLAGIAAVRRRKKQKALSRS